MIETNGLSNNGKVKLLGVDMQGSVVRCHTANMQLDYAYTAFGHGFDRVRRNGSAHASLAFNGQRKESDGLYLLGNGHRAYNPQLMVFHSPDRLSPFDRGGINAYAYCGLDPVNWQDPTGRQRGQVRWRPGLDTIYEGRTVTPIKEVVDMLAKVPMEALPGDFVEMYTAVERFVKERGELRVELYNAMDQAARMSKRREFTAAAGSDGGSRSIVNMMWLLSDFDGKIKSCRVAMTKWVSSVPDEELEVIMRRAGGMWVGAMSNVREENWSVVNLIGQAVSTVFGLSAAGEKLR